MIFDLAFKQVRCLFKSWHLFSIVYLSRVEWQMLMPVFMSLIAQFEANTFIKVCRVHSLTLRVNAISPMERQQT